MNTFEWTNLTALSPDNLNEMQNIINDNIVNNEDVYSSDEIKTNKVWINNEPIYRKVFEVNIDTTSSGWKEVGTLNFSKILKADFVCVSSTETTRYRTNCTGFCNLSFYNNKCYTAGTGTFTGTLYLKTVIVEYIKS